MNRALCKFLVLVLVGLPPFVQTAQAQSWCLPGAEWRYSYLTQDWFYQPYGILQYHYEGDTLFQGELCQHIRSDLYLYDTTGVLHHSAPGSRFTSVTPEGAVRWYNTDVPGFDTLAWFGAPPGASWTLHYPFNQDKLITVEDTGAREVNGLLLRYVVVSSQPPAFSFVTDTIFERIGALVLNNFYPLSSYFMESSTMSGLGCYHDDGFSYMNPNGGLTEGECDSPVAVPEVKVQGKAFLVYPNPGNDRIRLDFPFDRYPVQATVFDIRGIPMLNGWIAPQSGMDMSMLAPGSYLIRLRNRKGQIHSVKWIKIERE